MTLRVIVSFNKGQKVTWRLWLYCFTSSQVIVTGTCYSNYWTHLKVIVSVNKGQKVIWRLWLYFLLLLQVVGTGTCYSSHWTRARVADFLWRNFTAYMINVILNGMWVNKSVIICSFYIVTCVRRVYVGVTIVIVIWVVCLSWLFILPSVYLE